jgi:hypothetical protein
MEELFDRTLEEGRELLAQLGLETAQPPNQ